MGAFVPRYSEERKAAVLKKLLPPANRKVPLVSQEEGIPVPTLYNWIKQCRVRGTKPNGTKTYAKAIRPAPVVVSAASVAHLVLVQ